MLIAKCNFKKETEEYLLEFHAEHIRCVPNRKVYGVYSLELDSLSVVRIMDNQRYIVSRSPGKIPHTKGFLSSLPTELLGEALDAYSVSSTSTQVLYLHEEIRKLYDAIRKDTVRIKDNNVPKHIPICTGRVILVYHLIFASADRVFYERDGEFFNLRFRDMSLVEDKEKSYRQELKRVVNGKCPIEYINTEEITDFTDESDNGKEEDNMPKKDDCNTCIIQLPKEEYVHREENGRQITICTLRQKAMHTIGLNAYPKGRIYTRHGKKYYRPYRNYFTGYDGELEKLVCAGYMVSKDETVFAATIRTYWFTRKGLDWLGEQLGIYIYNEDR